MPSRSRQSQDQAPPRLLKQIYSQQGIVYGPVQSPRLGASLGINLLPTSYKLCSFNCVYCQYGWSKRSLPAPSQLQHLPSVDEVTTAVESALAEMSGDHKSVELITICGNGEPTLYPALAGVILAVRALRDRYQPQARVAILSNSSTVGSPSVRAALNMFDLKIMKFDAGSEEMFRRLNHPTAPVYMGEIITGLKALENIEIQSLFVQGRVTNADLDSVEMWVEKVREIHPVGVQVYTLDHEPADKRIEKVSLTTLQWIADEIRWRAGVPAEVF